MDQFIMTAIDQIMMVLGLFIGVVFSEAVLQKAKTGNYDFRTLTKSDLIIYLVIAIIITPIVFQNALGFDPNLPFFIRFSLYVQAGISYPIMFNTIPTKKS